MTESERTYWNREFSLSMFCREFSPESNEGLDECFGSLLADCIGGKVTMEMRVVFILVRGFRNHSTAARCYVAVRRAEW